MVKSMISWILLGWLPSLVEVLTMKHMAYITSSTAQGGGGSFKNKKPIGEVGCCESGMAERSHCWIERCLISLTLSLSLTIYLPTYLFSMYLSISLSSYLSLPLSLSFDDPIYLSIDLSIYLSLSLSISPSIYLSLYVSI